MTEANYNKNNNYDENAIKYAQLEVSAYGTTLYLSFRDILPLIEESITGQAISELNILDYGCGAGRSTRYLKHIGAKNILSVDVNEVMIDKAKAFDPEGDYLSIPSAKIPSEDSKFDLVLCSFVLVEISTKDEILNIFNEIFRILKKDGIFIIVTLSTEFFDQKYDWLTYDQKYPENHNLKTGDHAKFKITNIDMVLQDYYWTNKDIEEIALQAKLNIVKIHYPRGEKADKIEWKSEKDVSPYVLHILKK